jgi:PAS domain S-box-containing protein
MENVNSFSFLKEAWNTYKYFVENATDGGSDNKIKNIAYWRGRLFTALVLYTIPVSMIALIPGVYIGIKDGAYFIAAFDILTVILIGFIALNKALSLYLRKVFVISLLYILALVLIFNLGSFGPGVLYLLAITVFTSLIFHSVAAYWCVVFHFITCFFFGFIIHAKLFDTPLIKEYNLNTWIAFSSNIIFLSLVCIALIARIINGLEETLSQELLLKTKLEVEATERLDLVERLKESENHYKGLFDQNPTPMWLYDTNSLQFLQVNEAAVKNYGFSKDEFLSMTIKELKAEEDLNELFEAISSDQKTESTNRHLTRHYTKSKQRLEVEIGSNAIEIKGKKVRLIIAQDITEMVRFEQILEKLNSDLAEEKRKLSETQLLAKVAGWELFLENRELQFSDEMLKITGIKSAPGKSLFEIYVEHIHTEDRPLMIIALEVLLNTGVPLDVTHRITFPDGSVRYARQLAVLEYKYGKPYKVIGTMQDITELKQMELEKNKYLFSLEDTLNTMNEGFYALNKNFVVTKANKHFERDTGKSNADTIGKKLIDIFPGIEQRETFTQLQKAMKERISIKFETYSRNMKKWIFVTAYPTTEGLAVYFEDITAAKEKDLKLKEAVERYELVSKATQVIIYDYDMLLKKVNFNTNFTKLFNLNFDEIHGNLNWLRLLIHPEDLDNVLAAYENVIAKRETNWAFEYRVDTGQGIYKYVYDEGYFVYDEIGIPVRLIGAIRDIDALKRADEENRRLAEIITKVNNMVLVLDTEHRISWANKAFEDYSGYKMAEVMGKNPRDFLVGPETSPDCLNYITESCKRQETFSVEMLHYTRDQKKWVNIEFTPFFNDFDKYVGYIVVHLDVSSRKVKEEHIRKQNEALQQIAWLSSHEIRRPVASILGLAYLAKDAKEADDKDQIIEMINSCAEDLDAIVHNISQKVSVLI